MTNFTLCDIKLTLSNKANNEECNKGPAGPDLNAKSSNGQQRDASIQAVIVTTEAASDMIIEERMGVITGECTYGVNIFKGLFSARPKIVGARTENNARETV